MSLTDAAYKPRVGPPREGTRSTRDRTREWSSLQPLAVQRYAPALLARNKTDRLDAALIADFAHPQQPRAWTPPTAAHAILQAQSRRPPP